MSLIKKFASVIEKDLRMKKHAKVSVEQCADFINERLSKYKGETYDQSGFKMLIDDILSTTFEFEGMHIEPAKYSCRINDFANQIVQASETLSEGKDVVDIFARAGLDYKIEGHSGKSSYGCYLAINLDLKEDGLYEIKDIKVDLKDSWFNF